MVQYWVCYKRKRAYLASVVALTVTLHNASPHGVIDNLEFISTDGSTSNPIMPTLLAEDIMNVKHKEMFLTHRHTPGSYPSLVLVCSRSASRRLKLVGRRSYLPLRIRTRMLAPSLPD